MNFMLHFQVVIFAWKLSDIIGNMGNVGTSDSGGSRGDAAAARPPTGPDSFVLTYKFFET